MSVKKAKIKDLIPDDANFNQGTEFGNALIEKSLTKFGAGRSILLDKNNRIIAGNKTVENAAANGFDNVQIVETDGKTIIAVKRTDVDLNTKKGREMALADNATAKANISWDFEALGEWEMPATEWGIEVPEQIEEPGDADAEPQIDKAAELNNKWKVQAGDLWSIGEHRLLCGDSTKREDVERLMDGKRAQMVFTDPPYNALKSWKKDEARGETRLDPSRWFANDNMEWDEFEMFLNAVFSQFNSHSAYVCCDYRIYPLVKMLLETNGYPVKHCIVWKKNMWGLGKRYRFQHEFIVYACKDDAPFHGDRSQSDVWEEDVDRETDHNTPKPIAIPARAIINSSERGESILDYFGGAGSTLVAAQNAQRKAFIMENAPRYCAVILERMSTAFPDLEIKRIENAKGKATT